MKRKSGKHASKKTPKYSRIATGFADSSDSEDFETSIETASKNSIGS